MNLILRRTRTVALWVVLGAVVVIAGLLIVLPRLMGWVPLTLLTGSMDPTIPTGSQVVVDRIEGEADAVALHIGDVITFMPYADDPTLVTHRVVGRTSAGDGSVTFTTRGDATMMEDPWTLSAEQVRGVVRYHVPYAGYAANVLDGNQKGAGVALAATGLLGYAAMQLASAARNRRRSARAVAA
ncbi:signal peptidase I [Georgenia faecalis]|uniref:Signal peptidase I n=1 Tax=Georgenia faecalis TaxID=2483799 RepID=A0ABV9D6X7_9MICO|nr:signal peptidase I [Georgenia faecalis]